MYTSYFIFIYTKYQKNVAVVLVNYTLEQPILIHIQNTFGVALGVFCPFDRCADVLFIMTFVWYSCCLELQSFTLMTHVCLWGYYAIAIYVIANSWGNNNTLPKKYSRIISILYANILLIVSHQVPNIPSIVL